MLTADCRCRIDQVQKGTLSRNVPSGRLVANIAVMVLFPGMDLVIDLHICVRAFIDALVGVLVIHGWWCDNGE